MATGGIWQYIGSNSLTFVRDEDSSNPQTDTNRLYGSYIYKNQYLILFSQKVEQTDSLWFQFRTNYSEFSLSLVDRNGTETALTYTLVQTYDTYSYYNVTIDVSGLDGCYYVKSTANSDADKVINNWTSNYFHVKSEWSNTLLLEWYGNNARNDGFIWEDNTQELRLEATFIDNISAGELVTMIDSDNNIIPLDYEIAKRKILNLNLVPDYICQLLNRIIGRSVFAVNSELCGLDSLWDFGDRKGDSQMYSPFIELQIKDYENYNKIEELEGDLPVITNKSLQFDTGVALQFDTGIGLRFQ